MAQQLNIRDAVAFNLGRTGTVIAATGLAEIGIDEQIIVSWDESAFMRQVVETQGFSDTARSLVQRIEFLEYAAAGVLRTQAALLSVQEIAARLATARLENNDPETISALQKQFFDRNNRFSTEGLTALSALDSTLQLMNGGADSEFAARFETELNNAMLKGYEQLAVPISNELDRLNAALAARFQSGKKVKVFMEAWLQRPGSERAVHLDGYDDLSTGRPVPYSRFQLALSEGAMQELDAAAKLGQLVEDAGAVEQEAKAAFASLLAEIRAVVKALDTDVLQGTLTGLRASFRTDATTEAAPILEQLNSAIALVGALTKTPEPQPAGALQSLAAYARWFNSIILATRTAFTELPDRLTNLSESFEAHLRGTPDTASSEGLQLIQNAAEKYRTSTEVTAVVDRIRTLQDTFGFAGRLAGSVMAVNRIGRQVGPGTSLDTALDLLGVTNRRNGDRVHFKIRVVKEVDGQERSIAETSYLFKLRVFGLYVEQRASLIFVDPRSAGFGAQSFEPTVSYSQIAHVGIPGAALWNDLLNPGIGLTLALLDFEDTRDLEVGISASATLFSDVLWIGYGRNLQAEADYFYLGINPLAFGNVLGGGSILGN